MFIENQGLADAFAVNITISYPLVPALDLPADGIEQ